MSETEAEPTMGCWPILGVRNIPGKTSILLHPPTISHVMTERVDWRIMKIKNMNCVCVCVCVCVIYGSIHEIIKTPAWGENNPISKADDILPVAVLRPVV